MPFLTSLLENYWLKSTSCPQVLSEYRHHSITHFHFGKGNQHILIYSVQQILGWDQSTYSDSNLISPAWLLSPQGTKEHVCHALGLSTHHDSQMPSHWTHEVTGLFVVFQECRLEPNISLRRIVAKTTVHRVLQCNSLKWKSTFLLQHWSPAADNWKMTGLGIPESVNPSTQLIPTRALVELETSYLQILLLGLFHSKQHKN